MLKKTIVILIILLEMYLHQEDIHHLLYICTIIDFEYRYTNHIIYTHNLKFIFKLSSYLISAKGWTAPLKIQYLELSSTKRISKSLLFLKKKTIN